VRREVERAPRLLHLVDSSPSRRRGTRAMPRRTSAFLPNPRNPKPRVAATAADQKHQTAAGAADPLPRRAAGTLLRPARL